MQHQSHNLGNNTSYGHCNYYSLQALGAMSCLVFFFFAPTCAPQADRPLKLCTNPTSLAGPNPNHGPSANLDHLTVGACSFVNSFRVNNGWEGSFQGKSCLKCAFRAQRGTKKDHQSL